MTNAEKSEKNVTKLDKIWQNLTNVDKIWQYFTKSEKARQKLTNPDEARQNLTSKVFIHRIIPFREIFKDFQSALKWVGGSKIVQVTVGYDDKDLLKKWDIIILTILPEIASILKTKSNQMVLVSVLCHDSKFVGHEAEESFPGK